MVTKLQVRRIKEALDGRHRNRDISRQAEELARNRDARCFAGELRLDSLGGDTKESRKGKQAGSL